MSDWDFLHDMHNEGYSPDQIADAAACGYNPYDSLNFECLGFSSDEWEELDDSEEATCIGCGCTDSHACVDDGVPYHWLRLDLTNAKGVCSACPDHVSLFDQRYEPVPEYLISESSRSLVFDGHIDLELAHQIIASEVPDFSAPKHTWMRYVETPEDEDSGLDFWREECAQNDEGAEPVTRSTLRY